MARMLCWQVARNADTASQSSNMRSMCYYKSSRSKHNTWALPLHLPYLKHAQGSNNAQSTLSNLSSLLATKQS